MPKHTILIVDDERNILSSLSRLLQEEERQILVASSAEEAWETIKKSNGVDLVISDNRLPAMSGIEFLAKVRQVHSDTVRMLITGYPDLESAVSAINKGQVYRYILKPWENDELKLLVKQALDYYDVLRDNRALVKIARQQAEYLANIRKQFPQIPFPAQGLYEVDTNKVSRELAELFKKYSI
jgi:DNA-binding NtrC family response regulator